MGFNYAAEKKKFETLWARLRREYRAAGMSDTAIQKMHDFDWEVFKQERIYRLHTQDMGIGIFDESSAEQEDKSALMKKFLESVSRWDDYTTASRYGWIEEVDDPLIYKQLQALRKADLELLTFIVVDGFSQTEVAAVLGCSPQNIFGRLKNTKNFSKVIKKTCSRCLPHEGIFFTIPLNLEKHRLKRSYPVTGIPLLTARASDRVREDHLCGAFSAY